MIIFKLSVKTIEIADNHRLVLYIFVELVLIVIVKWGKHMLVTKRAYWWKNFRILAFKGVELKEALLLLLSEKIGYFQWTYGL